jgi:hypothetical protein
MDLDGTKLEVLSEHYSDTFSAIQSSLKKRDRLFAGMLTLLFLMLFQLYAPAETSNFIAELIADKLESNEQVNFVYVQSAIWFVLLAASVKYFQTVVLIERQYDYIHSLEAIISVEYDGQAFTREGASYLEDYPAFLNWASFLYTVLFPAILVAVSVTKIINEFWITGYAEPLIWFNALMFLFLLVSVGLYLNVLHSKKESTQETEQ